MIRKVPLNEDVVTMAQLRLKNIFNSAGKVCMSISGGKDSICLNDLVYKLCISGQIDKDKLEVNFIDEEAIYPCVEKIVMDMREKWIKIGVKFNWFCIQVRHYNCLNSLVNDESFICWDETKKDLWIRNMPDFAINNHPLLKPRQDTYQMFLTKKNRGKITINGVRATESFQRYKVLARKKNNDIVWPIYDWSDSDIWRYIMENECEFPEAYEYMFRVGVPLNRLRISQFFSIDTMPSLVQMCEFYPDLFDKICKREPNAYMAALYYDTELYRRKKRDKDDETKDYKNLFFKTMAEQWRFQTKSSKQTHRLLNELAIKFGALLNNDDYKKMYECAIAGDPKNRTYRGILTNIVKRKGEL